MTSLLLASKDAEIFAECVRMRDRMPTLFSLRGAGKGLVLVMELAGNFVAH